MKKAALAAVLAALMFVLPGAATPPASSAPTTLQCPTPTVTVGTMAELESAVASAKPGDVIEMEPGTYEGRLVLERSGAKTNPIWLCGPRDAVIDAGDVSQGRVVHMKDADNWRLVGFTVTNAMKGLTISGVNNSVFAGLHVHHIGHEAVHLLRGSTDNVVRDSEIHDTGITNQMFGEGVYIGTARDNWRDAGVDYSNRNQVIGNTIYDTTAEAIDIKEGTKDGVIRGNVLDGASTVGQADSWVTVKGQRYVIEDNVGRNSPFHGFESQKIRTDGLVVNGGQDNIFRRNTAYHDGDGYAFYTRELRGVVVACDNEVIGSGRFTDLAVDCGEPEPEPTPTPEPSPAPTPKPEPSPTPSPEPKPAPAPSPSPTPTPTPTQPPQTPPSEPAAPKPASPPTFFLADGWSPVANHAFPYGRSTDEVLIGDWNGDGKDTIALRRGHNYHVSNRVRGGGTALIVYGKPNDVVLVGDWDGDGRDTFAVRRGKQYHVKNSMSGGDADVVFWYGRRNDEVLVGDWNGDGRDTLAVRRGKEYHVRNSVTGGPADVVFKYGRVRDQVLVGDWDGDGRDTFAVRRGRIYHVKNSMTGGDADIVQSYGRPGDEVFVGDWNGDRRDTLGLRRH